MIKLIRKSFLISLVFVSYAFANGGYDQFLIGSPRQSRSSGYLGIHYGGSATLMKLKADAHRIDDRGGLTGGRREVAQDLPTMKVTENRYSYNANNSKLNYNRRIVCFSLNIVSIIRTMMKLKLFEQN